jgi:hypothetical protein
MTPDNGGYATAAYVLATLVYLVYIVSLKIRERNLRRRLAELTSRPHSASNTPAGA